MQRLMNALQLRLGVAMMIGEALCQFDPSAEFAQAFFEAFRRGDAAKRTDVSVAQAVQR